MGETGQQAAALFAASFVSRAMQIAQRQKEAKMAEQLTNWEAAAIIAAATENTKNLKAVVGRDYAYIVQEKDGRTIIIRHHRKEEAAAERVYDTGEVEKKPDPATLRQEIEKELRWVMDETKLEEALRALKQR